MFFDIILYGACIIIANYYLRYLQYHKLAGTYIKRVRFQISRLTRELMNKQVYCCIYIQVPSYSDLAPFLFPGLLCNVCLKTPNFQKTPKAPQHRAPNPTSTENRDLKRATRESKP